MKFSNKTYDRLKFVVLIVLPAVATLYLGLADLWDLPEPEKVGASIGLFAAFLGVLLQISNSNYKGEDLSGFVDITNVDEDTGIPDLQFTLKEDHVLDFPNKDKAIFKVRSGPEIEEH